MRQRAHRRGGGAIAVLGLAGVLVACSGGPAANDLEVGDCIEDETSLNDSGLATIDCGDDHTLELIGRFDVEGDDYPGEDELRAQGDERCTGDLFEEYVGAPYDPEGDVLVTAVLPSEDSWSDGDDRTILCFAHAPDLAETDASVEDSAEG
jgi:hypothetical protein